LEKLSEIVMELVLILVSILVRKWLIFEVAIPYMAPGPAVRYKLIKRIGIWGGM
jgi:hypothetical protein